MREVRGNHQLDEKRSTTVMMTADRHNNDDDLRSSDPTTITSARAFDSTDRAIVDVDVDTGQRTQLSDPPTSVVRRESFRELPPGSVVGDTYEIDARLGAGAMGEVYAAHHMRLGKRVAIKVIGQRLSDDDASIERFAMEARTLAQIQHPAIVAVEHVGELSDGRAYFVMEFLRGESLFERLQRGRVPLPEALRILDQMARGLDAAHGEGVTHRDLKPENTFLVHLPGEPPAIKLLDFGLAKLAAGHAAADRRAESTQSGAAIGTPMYMSPEQMRGPDVDHRTDIYALGCVAYEMVLGQPPFPHAHTAPELYAAHLHEAPPLPRSIWPEIPPQLDLALFAMLAKDPAHRPTLEQVRKVITNTRGATASQRAATEFVGHRAAKQRRRKLTIGSAVIVALISGVTIGVSVGSRSNESVGPTKSPREGEVLAAPPPTMSPPIDASTTPDPKRVPAPPPPRNIDSVSRSKTARHKPNTAGAPIDAGVDAAIQSTPPMIDKPKPLDRNQTINPFAKKPKVNP